jgi:multiple antibiotic resistance protein
VEHNVEIEKKEPIVVPIATPLIAGPGLLSSIMLYSHRQETISPVLAAVLIAWFLSSLVILMSQPIGRRLSKNAIEAIERLFGLILTIMSINMIAEGVFELIKIYSN